MKKISISKIFSNQIQVKEKIKIQGWIRTRRDSKLGISFINIYDGSCFNTIQGIVDKSLSNYSEVLSLTTGCAVKILGELTLSPNKMQKYEIKIEKINVIGWVKNPEKYPISPKNHSLEYLRSIAHLRPRTNFFGAITRIRHLLAKYLHKFFHKEGFYWVPTPIITSLNTEGAGEMFRISSNSDYIFEKENSLKKNFFKKEAFLTVSGQLNAEAYASALSKVYTFGPTFRAENSHTSKHLAEFWMLEPEIAYANLNNITDLAEKMLKYVFKKIIKYASHDMNFFATKVNKNIINRLEKFIDDNIIKINYKEIIYILNTEKKFKDKIFWGVDINSEHEKFLTKKYFKNPIVIKNYPKNIKAFYMRLNEDKKTVAAMDFIFPDIGEIIGGSEREERLDILDIRIKENGLNKKNYWWYRELRKYGTVFHAGFGLGFERLISYITGVKNIRDISPFPRTANNIDF